MSTKPPVGAKTPSPPVDSRLRNPNGLRVINAGFDAGDTQLPYSPQAEAAVVGSLLIDRDTIIRVITIINSKDFMNEEYAMVFEAVAQLYMEGSPCDVVTLRDKLQRDHKLGDGDGQLKASTLLELMRSSATPVHAEHYAKIVKDYAVRRHSIVRCTYNAGNYLDTSTKLENVMMQELDRLRKDIAWLKENDKNERLLDHAASFTYMERLEAHARAQQARQAQLAAQLGLPAGTRPPRLRFGWPGFDGDGEKPPQVIMQSSNFITVIAKTSVGKTIFCECVAEANAAAGIDVLFVMTELNIKQMEDRRICRLSNMDYMTLALAAEQGDTLQDYHRTAVDGAISTISAWPGREDFFYASGLTADQIIDEIQTRQLMLMTSENRRYRLIVIDYIGRIEPARGYERANDAAKIGSIVRTLAAGATQMDVAMLCLSQVNRAAGKDEEGLKQDSGIGSSAIEQCSNLELALELDKDDSSIVNIKCLKYTFGPKDWSVTLRANYPHYRFENGPAQARPPARENRWSKPTATVPEDMGWDEVDNYQPFDPTTRRQPPLPENHPPF